MREILFRGKRVNNGEWVEGGICDYNNGVSIFAINHCFNTHYEPPYNVLDEIEVMPETVGQYTGLTDKNGKKIFEGDIVKFIEDKRYCYGYYYDIGYIFYKNENAKFIYQPSYTLNGYPIDNTCTYEIIGNIYDNPELLKGEQKS